MFKYNYFIGLLALMVLIMGCRKVKLEGEAEVLVGKWLYLYTIEQEVDKYGRYYDTLYLSNQYQVEFIEKGKVDFIKNGDSDSLKIIRRISFNDEYYNGGGHFAFGEKKMSRNFF